MFIVLGGAIIGMAVRYGLPHRHTHGVVLVPAIGAAVSAVLWIVLTWAGMKWNGGWIWWIALIGTAVITVAVDLLLGSTRTRGDDRLLHRLQRGATAEL